MISILILTLLFGGMKVSQAIAQYIISYFNRTGEVTIRLGEDGSESSLSFLFSNSKSIESEGWYITFRK